MANAAVEYTCTSNFRFPTSFYLSGCVYLFVCLALFVCLCACNCVLCAFSSAAILSACRFISVSFSACFSYLVTLCILPPLDLYMNSYSFHLLSLPNSISVSLYLPLWLPSSLLRPFSLFLFSTVAVLCNTPFVRLPPSFSVSLCFPPCVSYMFVLPSRSHAVRQSDSQGAWRQVRLYIPVFRYTCSYEAHLNGKL